MTAMRTMIAAGPEAIALERAEDPSGRGRGEYVPAEAVDVPASAANDMSRGVREPIERLLGALDRAGIRYCHWKSNIRLAASLSGSGDLDLLVDRADAARFEAAVAATGFKIAVSSTGIGHPGVFHAFALDPERAELIHLHAYFQVVTGDSLVKSFRLPFEETLMSGTRRLHGVPVPSVEAELIMFALRIALKHTSVPEVLLIHRDYRAISQELTWLRTAASAETAFAIWRAWLPQAPESLLDDLLDAIAEPRAILQRIRLGRQVARHLSGWRRLGPVAAAASRWWRVVTLVLGRLWRRRSLVPRSGGAVIAFVGPKATGKSTLSAAVAKRLGHHYDVRRVHVGKPPPTFLSFLPRLLLPLARRMAPGERSGVYEARAPSEAARSSFLHVLRTALLAYDRRALLRRCWRQSAAGAIVITDRYPSASIGAADSCRFGDTLPEQCDSPLKRALMAFERRCYAELPQPRLVIRLNAPLSTTIRRDAERDKRDAPDAAAVARRRQIETETEFPGARVVCVNSDRALEVTIRTAMQAVWETV